METIITSLTIGLLATTSPCVLPLYPGFLAYISGGQDGLQGKSSRYFLGFFVLAGVLTMMLALGGIIALLSVSIGRALSFIIPIADAMMSKETPAADAMMEAPAWYSASLTNASTGQAFTINDFKGKVVLVETLAMWLSLIHI